MKWFIGKIGGVSLDNQNFQGMCEKINEYYERRVKGSYYNVQSSHFFYEEITNGKENDIYESDNIVIVGSMDLEYVPGKFNSCSKYIRLDLVRGTHIGKKRDRGKQAVLEISLVARAEVSADAENARLRHINVGVASRYSLLELAVDVAICVLRVEGDRYVGKLTRSEIDLIKGDTLIGALSAVSEPEEGVTVCADLHTVAVGRAVLIVARDDAKLACGSILVNLNPSLKGMGMLRKIVIRAVKLVNLESYARFIGGTDRENADTRHHYQGEYSTKYSFHVCSPFIVIR